MRIAKIGLTYLFCIKKLFTAIYCKALALVKAYYNILLVSQGQKKYITKNNER